MHHIPVMQSFFEQSFSFGKSRKHCFIQSKGFIRFEWRGGGGVNVLLQYGKPARYTVAQLVVNNWETIWLCLDRGICKVWE